MGLLTSFLGFSIFSGFSLSFVRYILISFIRRKSLKEIKILFFFFKCLIPFMPSIPSVSLTNSVDSYRVLQNVTSDLGLQCLHYIKELMKRKKWKIKWSQIPRKFNPPVWTLRWKGPAGIHGLPLESWNLILPHLPLQTEVKHPEYFDVQNVSIFWYNVIYHLTWQTDWYLSL